MTLPPDQDVTLDLAALQMLPVDDVEPDIGDPTCATTGVGGRSGPDADPVAGTDPATDPVAGTDPADPVVGTDPATDPEVEGGA